MSATVGLTFEVSDLIRGLSAAAVHPALTKGVAQAGLQLMNDAVMDTPTVPLEEGTLRGSGSLFVNNQLSQVSQAASGGTPCTDHQEAVGANEIVAVVGFNTPYAAYQHEGIRKDGTRPIKRHTEPGSGTKFLEKKLAHNRDTYMEIVAKNIREAK